MSPSKLDAGCRLLLGVTERSAGNMKDPAARAAALARAGLGGQPAFFLKQVHGARIVRVGPATPTEPAPEADGWITDLPNRALCVFAADCLPLFLWDVDGRAVGVFHCGWRGLAAGMPGQAVAAFQRFYGIPAGRLRARSGPHIGPCCYRVGPELEERFRPASLRKTESALFLDLDAEARAQLAEAGIAEERFSREGACTSCRNDLYFSFRREKQDRRMMAYAAIRSEG